MAGSSALLTDHYELTMVGSWLAEGIADTPAVFEGFARSLPVGRQYGVVAGVNRLLDLIDDFQFDSETLTWLLDTGVITGPCADWLSRYRFSGNISGYRDGDLYFPGSPVLTVSGGLAECAVLETLVLSVLNHDSAVASAAARMVHVAAGRRLIEMGGRRTHEQAAVASAVAAFITGFDATSNLQAGRLYDVPTAGTAAHAFTLSFPDERAAFAAQIRALGVGTTLLVDTFDVTTGIINAVEVAGTALGAIRIDSGDPIQMSRQARSQLDSLGAHQTRIVVTGDLDEYVIETLADSPVDAYGVGTRLVTGSGHPTAGLVYKLVAIADRSNPDGVEFRAVAKSSEHKVSVGGRKTAYRILDSAGYAIAERVDIDLQAHATHDPSRSRALQTPLLQSGERIHQTTLDEVRAFHRAALAELPASVLDIASAPAFLVATIGEDHG
jgi:putative nicotinate phosphoribosyltransferase